MRDDDNSYREKEFDRAYFEQPLPPVIQAEKVISLELFGPLQYSAGSISA